MTGYDVFRNGTQVGSSTSTSYTDSGLTASTAYSYTVKARDAAGNVSAASTALSVTTLAPDTTAPSVPSGLTAPSKTSTSVSLTWTASTDASGIAGYDVYRNGSLVGSPVSASYTDSGLTAGVTYSYTVRARDTAGNVSALGAALSVTTSTTGATVTFNETASTVMGQNIYVVGNIAALGGWNTASAIQLSPNNYPT